MSKHDRGYDPIMMRFVGNLIAGAAWTNLSSFGEDELVERALRIARKARKELKKEEQE